MKICVLELDCAAPEIVFGDERLVNLRRLMEAGVYGRLRDPACVSGSGPSQAASAPDSIFAGIREVIAGSGAKWIALGGRADGCTGSGEMTAKVARSVADQGEDSSRPSEWDMLRSLVGEPEWDYIQVVDGGLRTLEESVGAEEPEAVSELYHRLDEQVGRVLELLDDHTLVLVASLAAHREVGAGEAEKQAAGPCGLFMIAAPNCPLRGEYEGAGLQDIAPTVLDLAGYALPENLPGRSLVAGMEKKAPEMPSDEDERAIRDRLSGLGYI